MKRVLLVIAAAISLSAQGRGSDDEALLPLKKETQILEGIISGVLKQNFSNPFAIAAEPKGAYLPGYGIIVSYQLRISRSTVRTPFGEVPSPIRTASRTKRDQIALVRDSMTQVLGDYGSTIKHIGNTERIVICASIEDRNELDVSKSTTVLAIGASKSWVEQYVTKRITFEQFKGRVEVVEY